ncbi:MAG: hypothetical protein EZS28_030249, partial [Streblomastix strix]
MKLVLMIPEVMAWFAAHQMQTNKDLQIKLASLLLSVCFLRLTEISEVDINLSNFYFGNHAAILKLSPKITNTQKQYELERLSEHFHQEITTFSSLFWTKQWKPMSIAKILKFLILLIKKIGIDGFTAYSIKHASTTKLAAMGIQEREMNIFTFHGPDYKSARNYYVFAANRQVNGIAARLVTIDHGLENLDSTSTNVSQQKRKNEAPNGDIHTLSPQGGDSMLSPFGTSFLPLSHPGFLPNPSSELKVQTSNANTTTSPFQIIIIVEWEELRF